MALNHRHVLALRLPLGQRAAQHALLRRAVGGRDGGGAAVVVDGHTREGNLGGVGWRIDGKIDGTTLLFRGVCNKMRFLW